MQLENIAIVMASAGVYFYVSKWPDLIVALFMAMLSVSASLKVLVLVKNEFESSKLNCA